MQGKVGVCKWEQRGTAVLEHAVIPGCGGQRLVVISLGDHTTSCNTVRAR